MLRRFKSSVTFLMKLLAFLLCAACFFGLFGLEYFFLLRPSRTLGVTAVAFVVVYILMTKVYGGFDIGKRKSKPIVFSMALTLLLTACGGEQAAAGNKLRRGTSCGRHR